MATINVKRTPWQGPSGAVFFLLDDDDDDDDDDVDDSWGLQPV